LVIITPSAHQTDEHDINDGYHYCNPTRRLEHGFSLELPAERLSTNDDTHTHKEALAKPSRRQRNLMRISKERAAANHDQVVQVASKLFRERGFDGVGVADLMRAAGFTHGGFYNHFESKEALAVEAVARAFRDSASARSGVTDLRAVLTSYLSPTHRDAVGTGCPTAGLGSDTSRQPESVRAAFAEGMEDMAAMMTRRLEPLSDGVADARSRAINLLAKLVGALILARAAPDGSPISDEILETVLAGALREARLVQT
jgi:TetR/AcrR family transcriptional repressor of nem operon